MRTTATVTADDGIRWYYEQEGSGPDIVLIPDGYGDCAVFDQSITEIARNGFRVTTFDMPGLSRSADAPLDTYKDVTAQRLARYIVSLLDLLKIKKATFWGSSSGASAVLVICKDFPERVRNALVHEAPTMRLDHVLQLDDKDDETISQTIESRTISREGRVSAWAGLSSAARARLWKNYPVWYRGYVATLPPSTPMKDLNKISNKPVVWTVGSDTPTALYFDNVVCAARANIEIKLLPGGHFVFVSHPTEFVKHVVEQTRRNM